MLMGNNDKRRINELSAEIDEMRNSLTTDHMDMSFGELTGMYERGELVIDPSFQRLYRWTPEQKTRFIESIILGIPIPPIFVAEDKNGAWELVDGLQRISTILSFFGQLKNVSSKSVNNWNFVEASLLPSLEGFSAQSLPPRYLLNLKRAVCRVEVIKWNSKWDMRYELFNRLNTGGSILNEQEIRNCIFRSGLKKFYAFIDEAKNNEQFKKITGLSLKQKQRLVDEDLIVRYVALVNDWQKVDAAISVYVTSYMKHMLDIGGDIPTVVAKKFYQCVTIASKIGPSVFRIGSTFSPSLFDAIMVGMSIDLKYFGEHSVDFAQAVKELKNSAEFKALRGGAGSKNRTRRKLAIAVGIFRKFVK